MALFLSTVLNKMDSKCRVSVPSTFRTSLKNQSFKGVVAFPSYKTIQLMPVALREWKKFQTVSIVIIIKEEFDLISLYFGEAEQLPFDKEGRIILPKKLINHAQIKNNVVVCWSWSNF